MPNINVADSDRLDAGVLGPEEVQRGDAPEVDEVRRRPDVVRAKLVGVAEAELEQVDGHEGEQHEARDGQVQDADALALHQGQLHVPGSLQAHKDVEQHGQEDVLLNDVGWKAEARPVQPHVEVAVAVEVIWACMYSAHCHTLRNLSQAYMTWP